MSRVNPLELNSALGSVLRHDLADLIHLGIREAVVDHFEYLEAGLPGKEDQQRNHASIPIVFKPSLLVVNCDAL